MNIPIDLLSKMFSSEIEIAGVKVKVTVADHDTPNLVDHCVSELKSLLKTRAVGIDIKFDPAPNHKYFNNWLLLLCVGTRCLVILHDINWPWNSRLREFLGDANCFVGEGMKNTGQALDSLISEYTELQCGIAEVGYLASRVLKNPSLKKCSLGELADEFAMNFGMKPQGSIDVKAKYLSDEEIKYAVHDAYRAYTIGNYLLGLI